MAAAETSSPVPIPRRTTRGPLDVDPLAEQEIAIVSPTPSLSTPAQTVLPGSSPLPSSSSQRLPIDASSARPLATQQAPHSSINDSPSPQRNPVGRPKKDFSFLFNPTVYQPLPGTSVPAAFHNSPYQPQPDTPLQDLLSHGHFRHAAVVCANTLTNGSVDPHDDAAIFALVQTRLSCLLLLELTPLAAAESKALGDLTSVFYRDPIDQQHVVPWELRVLCVRLQALGFGDARRGIMGYYELGKEAKLNIQSLSQKKNEDLGKSKALDEIELWKDRLSDLGIRVADALIEMGDLEGAARYLENQRIEAKNNEVHAVRLALVWLRVGDVNAARRCLNSLDTKQGEDGSEDILGALINVAEGDYNDALEKWQKLREIRPENEMARSLLEALIDKPASFHALTFNLATIYELCTEHAKDRKLELAERISMHEPAESGWERTATDFKL
ncbi:MAG: hypothetical protein M1820_003124 [Bogoriella megaspora]|nr:MAG: hypothetical protein M1820_003124 [Bogoriella megaspora]